MRCPKCGYEMSDFDEECPRCKRMASETPASTDAAGMGHAQEPGTPLPPVQPVTYGAHPAGNALPWIAGSAVLVCILAAGLLAYLKGTEATRKFNAGVAQHTDGNLVKAIELYNASIEADPDLSLSHLNLGLALLGGKPLEGIPEAKIQALMARGVFGDTQELERADKCFRNAISTAKKVQHGRPIGLGVTGEKLTADDVVAMGHLNLAVTALIRTGSAEQAGSARVANQWASVCKQHLATSKRYDPDIRDATMLQRLLAAAGY